MDNTDKPNKPIEEVLAELQDFLEKNNDYLSSSEKHKAVPKFSATQLLGKLIGELHREYDTTFLEDYHKVLETNDTEIITKVTDKIINSIEETLRQQRHCDEPLGEWQGIMLGVWLSAAVVWDAPQVPDAWKTYHALLMYLDNNHKERFCLAWYRAADGEALLRVSDATQPRRRLADLLLRAALHRLARRDTDPQWELGSLSAEEVMSCADRVSAEEDCLLLTRVAARVLARHSSPALLDRLDRLAELRDTHSRRLSLSVAKLRLLHAAKRRRAPDHRGPRLRRRT